MRNYPILYDVNRVKFGRLNSNRDILYLFKVIFNREFKEDLLDWFAACPTGANRWYGAFDGDIPVGMYGLLPIKVKIGSESYQAALCNNVGIVPEFQGKGLFQTLGENALKDSNSPIVVGVPNSKAVKGHKRIGWQSYGTLELLSGNVGEGQAEYVNYENFKYISRNKNIYFCLIKDIDFMKWRYAKPGVQYRQSFFQGDKYIIWKVYEGKNQVLETNDYRSILKLGGIVEIWEFQNRSSSQYLKKHGFFPRTNNEFILYKNQPIQIDKNPNEFNFELGDNDVF